MENHDVIYVDSSVPAEYNERVCAVNCEVIILTNEQQDGYYLIYYKPYYYTEYIKSLPDTLVTTGLTQYINRTDKVYYRPDVASGLVIAFMFLCFVYFIVYTLFRGIFRRS